MKKFLPFIFPLIAFVIVVFLAVRWYNAKTHRNDGKISDLADEIKVEDLTASDAAKLKKNAAAKGEKTVELSGADNVKGEVRYSVQNNTVDFSVYANLPDLQSGFYQVWLKQVNGDAKKPAFVLENTKAGYNGSAEITTDMLPIEVDVTQQQSMNEPMGTVILKGVLPQQNQQ